MSMCFCEQFFERFNARAQRICLRACIGRHLFGHFEFFARNEIHFGNEAIGL